MSGMKTETNGSLMNAIKNDIDDNGAPMSKSSDDEDRKLFLGGLSWDTNEEDIKGYFGKYGTVMDVSIKYDAMTGNPRGFGFITFAEDNAIDKVLASMPHSLKNKTIDPKRAKSRPICKKIFVGGLDANVSEEDIRKYFGKYGKVEGIELPFDRTRGRRREFCFIIFETEEGADASVKEAKQKIGGRECDIKKAQPQPVAQQQKRMQQAHYGGGGGGYYGGGGGGGYDDEGGYGGGYGGRNKKRGGGGGSGSGGYQGYGNGNYSGYGNYPGYGSNYYGYNQGYEGYYGQYPYGYDYWNQYGYGAGYAGEGGDYGQGGEAGAAAYGTGVSGAAGGAGGAQGAGAPAGGQGAGKVPGRKPGQAAAGYHPYRTATTH